MKNTRSVTNQNPTTQCFAIVAFPKWLRAAFALAFITMAAACFSPRAHGQTYALTNLFIETAPHGAMLASSTASRGMAYDSVSNLVYISGGTSPYISAFDGTAGTYLGNFVTTGVSGGTTFTIDQVGVAADGAIYGINLDTSSSSANKIYRWSNWLATATVAFNANALVNGGSLSYTSGRIGDTLAVTGSGANTLILAGVGSKPYFSLFYTSDGLNFTNTIINVSSGYTAAGNIFGICFYTNNTFLVKSASAGSSTIYLIQFPSNYSGQPVVTGTVLSTTTLGSSFNSTTMLNYSPASGFLAAAETGATPSPTALFNGANLSAGVTSLAQTNVGTTYASGNASGAVALGGVGGTNTIYEYTTGNSLYAFNIVSIPPQPPSAVSPGGGTSFVSGTLMVSPTGTSPFYYQWLASISNSATGTFTNIPGATSSTLTINSPSTNYYEVTITNIAGSFTTTPAQLVILQAVTNASVSTLWTIAPNAPGYSYISTDTHNRGLGYDTNSQRLVVSSTTPANGIYILDANTGTNIGTLNLTGVSGGTYAVDQVGVADDGTVYAGNLVTGGTGFTLYSWPAPTNGASATKVFGDTGSLGGVDRWGDTMAVRGSGASTEIILGSSTASGGPGTNVALITTPDGVNFSGEFIAITNAPAGFAALGIAFGSGNTFWSKNLLGDLYEISFDPVNQVGGVLLDYPNPSKIPSYQVGVGVDTVNNILAGVDIGDVNNDVRLYQLTGTSDAPILFDQSFFPVYNGNGNATVAIAMKYPRVFALDSNNGLIGLTYGVPASTTPTASIQPASQSTYTNNPSVVFTAQVTGSLPLFYQWQFSSSSNGVFANISGANNSTIVFTNPTVTASGFYQLVVHNLAGYATSAAPAQLTVLQPVSSVTVTPLWTIAGGGSLGFLDAVSFQTRGMAYDTNSAQVILADHSLNAGNTYGNIHLLSAANGSYLGDLNPAGLASAGYNNWLFDQVGVADDGTLYAGNLSLNGPGYSIVYWAPGYTVGTPASGYAYNGSGSTYDGTQDPGAGSGDRWGDTMSVRGSGTHTEILIGSSDASGGPGTNAVLFTTVDGVNFTPNLIAVNAPGGFCGGGIAFGAGDTFWAKTPGHVGFGYDLRLVSFDRTTTPWTGTVIQDFTSGVQTPDGLGSLAVDLSAGVIGGIDFNDTPNDVQLYALGNISTNPPALFDQVFFGSQNANSQFNGVTTLKGGVGFALDVNNGVTSFAYSSAPAAGSVQITSISRSGGNVTITWNKCLGYVNYQVQTSPTLRPASWSNLGSPVTATGASASFTDTNGVSGTLFYRVQTQ